MHFESIVDRTESLWTLPENHPFIHHKIEDAGEDEGQKIADDHVETGKMPDDDEWNHLD